MGTLALVPAGAGVWVFRYGGYVRLWLGCQDPLAGLWGIQWLRCERLGDGQARAVKVVRKESESGQ